eukprot:4845495-Heterocapsa_arctica.AAC.1
MLAEEIPVPDDEEDEPVPEEGKEDQGQGETYGEYEDEVGVVLAIGQCEQRKLQTDGKSTGRSSALS